MVPKRDSRIQTLSRKRGFLIPSLGRTVEGGAAEPAGAGALLAHDHEEEEFQHAPDS